MSHLVAQQARMYTPILSESYRYQWTSLWYKTTVYISDDNKILIDIKNSDQKLRNIHSHHPIYQRTQENKEGQDT